MTLPETIWFCVALVGLIAFGAKAGVEGEPIDIFALIAIAVYVGWMGRLL